jgi:hypothetical protein
MQGSIRVSRPTVCVCEASFRIPVAEHPRRRAGGWTRQRRFDGTSLTLVYSHFSAVSPTITTLVFVQGSGSIMKRGHGRSRVGRSSKTVVQPDRHVHESVASLRQLKGL